MARPNEEFALAWASISCDETTPSWQTIAIPAAGPVEVHAGRRSPGNRETVLFFFPSLDLSRAEALPEGKGFLVERLDMEGHSGLRLALTRQPEGGVEMFAAMACDVVGALDSAAAEDASSFKLFRAFLGRLHAWQRFMSRGALPLGAEAELGLAGELCVLIHLLDAGVAPESLINGWVGPDDAPQDLRIGAGAIEVKATMSSAGFPVKIGSLEQLDDAVVAPLFLAAVKFARAEDGLTLPGLVAEIEQRLDGYAGALDLFRARLLSAGFSEAHARHYSRRFLQKEWRFLSVIAGFPRLTLGTVPVGVSRAAYELDLERAEGFSCDLNDVLSGLGLTK